MTEETRDIFKEKTVDAMEPDSIRSKLLEIGWLQKRIFSGDYMFWTSNYKRVGVERKALPDLVSSLASERLARQLLNMTEYFDISILLLEGSWSLYSPKQQLMTGRGIEYSTWEMIWNFLRTWQDRGISLELTANEGHTIKRLNQLYSYYQKTTHSGGVKRSIVGDNRILALQCGGIGEKLGEALLAKFGSLRNLANGNVEEFESVEKIGHKKALALYNHFRRDDLIGGKNDKCDKDAGISQDDSRLSE